MPSIDIAMVQSLSRRRSLLDVVSAAMEPVVFGRSVSDVSDKITDVKTAFSSWDNCMDADFCKWPVIAVIIVGGLIILSIIWCIARCACCGLSCCCECCYCLKCCGNCLGCCDPPRGKKNKYLDEPYIPPDQGYRSEAPMATGTMPVRPTYKPPVHDAPQFASFDVSKTAGHEDALPVMPTWGDSSSKKIYMEEEEVEMDSLKKPEAAGPTASLLGTSATSPEHTTPSPVNSLNNQPGPYGASRSPSANNLGPSGHSAVSNGYLAAGAIPPGAGIGGADPFRLNSPGFNSQQQTGVVDYGGPEHTNDYGYGAAVLGPDRQSPRGYNNNNQQQGRLGGAGGFGSPPSQQQQHGGYGARNMQNGSGNGNGNYYDDYRRNGNSTPQGYNSNNNMDSRSQIPELDSGSSAVSEYGAGRPTGPSAGGPGRYASPGPYGSGPQPSRTPVNGRQMNNRPPPQRQYPGSSMGNGGNLGYNNQGSSNNGSYGNPVAPVSPTLQNTGGFDFSSGFSRPSTRGQEEYGNNGSSGGNNRGYNNNSGGYSNSNNGSNYNGGYDNSRPMNNATSPPPLAQPQPDRPGYQGYHAYRG